MSELANWLHEQREPLVEVLRQRLREALLLTDADEFLAALITLADDNNFAPLQDLLDEWTTHAALVRPGRAEWHLSTFFNLQNDLYALLRATTEPEVAVAIFIESAEVFRKVILYLNQIESMARLKHLKEELERTKERIQQIEKHKGDFISVAAHELKTPLTLIEGYANMIKADFPAEDYPRATAMLKGIMGGTQRLREIIEDMIDVSMIELQTLELNRQPVWLRRLLDILITEMRRMAEERRISINFEPESIPAAPIDADPERLFQVFQKIIENAIKYTPDGGLIFVYGRDNNGMAEIMIKDSGIGLDPKDHQVIFEKFYSLGQVGLHSSSKIKFKGGGPGLGLAIAKGIVEAHGGKIWVESEGYDEQKYKGSCFHVLLPRETIGTNAQLPDQAAVAYPHETPKQTQTKTDDKADAMIDSSMI